MFPMLFCSNSVHFSEIQLVCNGRTDGPTDGRTDGRTYTPSYRDARTHLKTEKEPINGVQVMASGSTGARRECFIIMSEYLIRVFWREKDIRPD